MNDTPRVAIVLWMDSSLQNGQVDRHGFPRPEVIQSIGILVDETEEYVTLARDDMGEGDYRGLICIPRLCIVSDKRLASWERLTP